MFFSFILLIPFLYIITTNADPSIDGSCTRQGSQFTASPCKHQNHGIQIQCIGSQLESNIITEFEAEMQLQEVISKFHSDNTYLSIGVQYGSGNAIIAARQTHYMFDASLALKLNPYAYYAKLILHVHDVAVTKPLLIFTDSNIDTDTFPKTALRFNVPKGDGKTSVVYSLPSATIDTLDKGTDACDSFSRWSQLVQLAEYNNIAVILPTRFYCRHTAHTYAEVIYGEFQIMEVKSGSSTQKYMRSTWHISKRGKRGDVPSKIESDFH